MNFDYSSLLGTGAILALIVSVIVWGLSLLVFYLVTRAAVSGGLRTHQLWMEKRTAQQPSQQQQITPPQQ
jgi:hypothetical protein